MTVRELTIAAAVSGVNSKYFLPVVQRPFVWKKEQILKLFDSVMKGYPFGTILLWTLPENDNAVDVFQFSKDIVNGEEGVPDPYFGTANGSRELVLDGQQRLTSLLIGCIGSVRDKDVGAKLRLYIDLLKNPNTLDDEGGRNYGFIFKGSQDDVVHSDGKFLFKVAAVMRIKDIDNAVEAYKRQAEREWSAGAEKLLILEKNLRNLYDVIMNKEAIVCTTYESDNGEEVLDIFIRLNSGGEKLTTGDLLASTMTMYWPAKNGRDEFKRKKRDLLKRLQGIIDTKRIDDQFLMKSLLFFFANKVEYDVNVFSSDFALKISREWDELELGLQRGVLCAKYAGFDSKTLTSANALLPVAYFCNVTGFDPSKQMVSNQEVLRNISKWLRASMLVGVYGGNSDSMLTAHRNVIERYCRKGQIVNFPGDQMNSKVADLNRIAPYSNDAIENILKLNYEKAGNRAKIKIALGMIQEVRCASIFEMKNMTVDHLHAQNLLEKSGFGSIKDVFANLAIMYESDNKGFKDKPLIEKINGISSGAYKDSLYVELSDSEFCDLSDYENFIKKREVVLRGLLESIFGLSK